MPSPRKRAVRAACGNILGGAPTDAQVAYSTAWWNTVVTEHSRNYAASKNGGKPFDNGESVLITGTDTDYDGLISGGETGAGAAIRAAASWKLGTGEAGRNAGTITLIDAAAVSRTYTYRGDAEGTSGDVITGTTIHVDRGDTQGGGQAKPIYAAAQMKVAIESSTGHNGSLKCVVDGDGGITVTQNTAGTAGNTTITAAADFNLIMGTNPPATFTGGSGALTTGAPHYWCDTTNAQAVIGDAATAKLTTATGVIYDPSGPLSKYIPALETVSANTAKYICILPTGWNANDSIAWELIGDTDTGDKLSLLSNTADNGTQAALFGVASNGTTRAAVTDLAGTIEQSNVVTYETANAGGVLLKWERDSSGGTPSDVSNGWYFRWVHTTV
jgi:hypothetical protein